MTKWENLIYDISASNRDFLKLEIHAESVTPIEPAREYNELRTQLISIRDKVFEEQGFEKDNKLDYRFDLAFGLELYELLNENKGFSNRVATNNDIWRYLSIKVIPDIVHARWGLNADRYYKSPRRIWLKTIWWYIHLSWMGTKEETYEILKDNTTDTVVQIVERPGIGYYVNVYRELIKQYKEFDDSSRDLFRSVLKINTARLQTTSPELVEGGIPNYVKELFEAALLESE